MASNTELLRTAPSSHGRRPVTQLTDRRVTQGKATQTGPPGPDVTGLLGLAEAAARLRVKQSFIRRLVAERRIAYYKVGRYLRFDPSELDGYVLRSRVDPREVTRRR